MSDIKSVRFIYLLTFITGFAGLAYQVIWQRYLTFIIGSESRSTALVVAIFLGGLASGYYYWGKITEKGLTRTQALKIYGIIEIAIGVYGISFPLIVKVVELVGPYLAFGFFSDLLTGSVMLLVPSFLMGATVPLLTAALPTRFGEINSLHAKIYGINTIGAFLGPLICAFLLVPNLGLPISLLLCGSLNIIAGLYFISSRLDGDVHKNEEVEVEKSEFFNTKLLLGVVFLSGLVTISIEVLLVRLISLAIGSSGLVYPIVLSLFILGLGWGSLSLKNVSVKTLLEELVKSLLFFGILSFSVPFLPYWFSNIRVSLVTLISNYYVYHIIIYLALGLLIIPMLISMGRLLPLSYGLIKKNGVNFADVCGRLYFLNTLGTLIGSLVLGHIILHWIDINNVFLINMILLIIIAVFASVLAKKKTFFVIFLAIAPLLIYSTFWDRGSHYVGLFIHKTPMDYNFQGVFNIPRIAGDGGEKAIAYFKDGPNTTVSVIDNNESKSIIVNGKSDGATTDSDLSTVVLLGALPLLLNEKMEPLKTAVIGFGTGITAGTLGHSTLVKEVDVLEIASNVIEAAPLFDEYNFNASKNDRINIIEADAFRYFSRANKKYDIIVSEPSNPWVVGVENLYTQAFMKKASETLEDGGYFVQWIHSYSMSLDIFTSIVNNLAESFEYITMFNVSRGDIAFVASNKPFKMKYDLKGDNALAEALAKIGITNPISLSVLNILNDKELRHFLRLQDITLHSREFPTVNIRAAKTFFMQKELPHHSLLVSAFESRFLNKEVTAEKSPQFIQAISDPRICGVRSIEAASTHYNCSEFLPYKDHYQNLYEQYSDLQDKLESYAILRKEALLEEKPEFLNMILTNLKGLTIPRVDVYENLVNEYLKDGDYSTAVRVIDEVKALHKDYEAKASGLHRHVEQIKKQVRIVGLERFTR